MLETIIHKTNILKFFRDFHEIIRGIFGLMNILFEIGFTPLTVLAEEVFLVRGSWLYGGGSWSITENMVGRVKTKNLYLENIFGLAYSKTIRHQDVDTGCKIYFFQFSIPNCTLAC